MNVNDESTPVNINYADVKTASLILRAMDHRIRQNIIKLLEENKRMMVTDIYVKMRLDQSVASQYLAILRRTNIVVTEREGKCIHYSLNYKRIESIVAAVDRLLIDEKNSEHEES